MSSTASATLPQAAGPPSDSRNPALDRALHRRVWRSLVRHRWAYLGGFLCLIASTALLLTIPQLLREAVDSLQHQPDPSLITTYALWIVALATLQVVIRTASRLLLLGTSRRVATETREALFGHLQSLPYSAIQAYSTGDLTSRCINDMQYVRSYFGPGFMYLFNTVVLYAVTFPILLYLSPALTLLALVPLPVLLLLVQRYSRRLHVISADIQERLAGLSTRLQQNINGIHVVKAYTMEDRETAAFDRLARAYLDRNQDLIHIRSLMLPLMGTMTGIGTLTVLGVGGWFVMRGELTLGEFLAFNAYLGMLIFPTIAMGWVINIFQRGKAALRRIEALFQIAPEPGIAAPTGSRFRPEIRGELELRDFHFTYPGGERPILSGVSLRVPAGSSLGIVGATGSGKSSLALAFTGLYPVSPGTVFLDGRDLRQWPLRTVRRAIGFVPQAAFLFSKSLEENLAYGAERAEAERLEAVAEIAHLNPAVDGFADRWGTLVGERGLTLSGGQRQRVSLARALYTDPRILILDDSLAAVDAETEQEILQKLAAYRQGRTCLVITHRLSVAEHLDRIVVLRDGRLCEEGTHQTLLARDGEYARMHRLQQVERELDQQA